MDDSTAPAFRALADPSRRLLLDRLFERDGQTLGELTAHLPDMTRFGVMRHWGHGNGRADLDEEGGPREAALPQPRPDPPDPRSLDQQVRGARRRNDERHQDPPGGTTDGRPTGRDRARLQHLHQRRAGSRLARHHRWRRDGPVLLRHPRQLRLAGRLADQLRQFRWDGRGRWRGDLDRGTDATRDDVRRALGSRGGGRPGSPHLGARGERRRNKADRHDPGPQAGLGAGRGFGSGIIYIGPASSPRGRRSHAVPAA